jgi:hypothetical protein
MNVERLEPELGQLRRWPSQLGTGAVGRRLRHDHPTAHPEERRSALGGDRRPAERSGHNEIEHSTPEGITPARLGPSPHDVDPGAEIELVDRFAQEGGAPKVGIQQDHLEVGPGARQHEPRKPATAAQVEDPSALEHEATLVTRRGQRPEEAERMLDVRAELSRSDEMTVLGFGQHTVEAGIRFPHRALR